MYDWANSAFATTILAAVLPVYFSQVAGATLPSPTVATSYWSIGLFISLLIVAIISPILGTISDITRGKKRFLAIFAGIGIVSTALLVLVSTGDWVLAAILGIIGRIGFSGSITFYDALLPHVAREEDRDAVSPRGLCDGLPGRRAAAGNQYCHDPGAARNLGAAPLLLERGDLVADLLDPALPACPRAAGRIQSAQLDQGRSSPNRSAAWLKHFGDVRRYRELFKFLIAFLIYNDGIGTIIGVAAIYGAELGFGSVELILALLLVQFVGIPYSLIFGRLPNPRRNGGHSSWRLSCSTWSACRWWASWAPACSRLS